MALYQYKAVSPSGETLRGEMEAVSSDEVIRKLQEAGNLPIQASEAGAGGALSFTGLLQGRNKISQKDIGVLTQQLATLLGAGLPLDRALQLLVELADGPRVEKMAEGLRDQVRGGKALSEALEAQHGVFPRLYINMVRAGELGGSLDETLARLSEYLERSKELRDSVTSAMIYPIILLIMAAASLIVLLVYVVPEFAPLFEELGGDLPMLTTVVLAVGTVLKDYWWALLAGVFLLVTFARRQMTQPESRYRWHKRFLNLRMIGDLIARMDTARLARTLGTLVTNGVPLLSALSISKNVMNNEVLAEGVELAAKEVKTGGGLARELTRTDRFPKLALQMISVGEETGELDTMLLKVADTYDREVKTTIDRILALMVPVVILVLAGIIAMIVMSILMAIMSVNQLVA